MDRRHFLTGACCAGAGLATGVAVARPGRAVPVTAPPGADAALFARQRFLTHWNCTQAVLEALASASGLKPEDVTRLTTPFAAGMWCGMTCGAVTGAAMAVGMRHGRMADGDGAATDDVKTRMRRFMAAMRQQFGNLDCSALLGVDMATDEGVKEAAAKGLFKSKCPLLVETAAREAARAMV